MVDLVTVNDGPSLVPASDMDAGRLAKLPLGVPLATKIVFSRSLKHNRWYRKLVAVVAEGIGVSPEGLHADLKFKAGLVFRILMSQAAGVSVILRSTAFDAMDQDEFQAYVSVAVEIVFRDFLPGVRRSDVFDKINEMVDPLWNIRMDDRLEIDELPALLHDMAG